MSELIDRKALLSKRGELAYCEVCPVWSLIKDAPAASPWHRVEDELPTDCETVLICGKMKYSHEKEYEVFVDAGIYDPVGIYGFTKHDGWMTWNDWHEGQQEFKITHWMSLPEPPKEEA